MTSYNPGSGNAGTVAPLYPSGEPANPVRGQVAGVQNDALGFCPVWGDRTIHIQNYDPVNSVNVYVGVLGYA